MSQEDVTVGKASYYRIFVQHAGSSPDNPYDYVGALSIDGLQRELGAGEPILVPSSTVRGQFDIVDETSAPPSFPTTDFTQRMDRLLRDFWWDLADRGCSFNFAIVGSKCARPDDPDDFEAKLLVRDSKLTALNTGAFNSLAEDAAIDLTGSLLVRAFNRFLPLTVGQVAAASVTTEVVDGVYADRVRCGGCGVPSDGCQRQYLLTLGEAEEPATASIVIRSIDGGGTWFADEIDTLGTDSGRRIGSVGRYIVVVSETDEAHHYKLQSSLDAEVVGGWTQVAGGYVASSGPRALWSKSARQTIVVGAGGYIYRMTSPTAPVTVLSDGSVTTQDLNDVRGFGRTVVAVGDSNAIVASGNDGRTWSLVIGPAVGVSLTSVDLISEDVWWVTTADGRAFFTIDRGENWTEKEIDLGPASIQMIRFVDAMVGYLVAVVGTDAYLFRTSDNGYSWHTDGTSYLDGVPQADRFNFVAPCPGNYNQVLAGGLAAVGTDGVVILGVA